MYCNVGTYARAYVCMYVLYLGTYARMYDSDSVWLCTIMCDYVRLCNNYVCVCVCVIVFAFRLLKIHPKCQVQGYHFEMELTWKCFASRASILLMRPGMSHGQKSCVNERECCLPLQIVTICRGQPHLSTACEKVILVVPRGTGRTKERRVLLWDTRCIIPIWALNHEEKPKCLAKHPSQTWFI